MASRTFRMMAFSLILFTNAASAWPEKATARRDRAGPPSLLAEIHIRRACISLTFESVSGNGMDIYEIEFGRGYVDLDLASLSPDGRSRFFHIHY